METDTQTKLHQAIIRALAGLEYDVVKRNQYMKVRYDAIYGDGLWRNLDIEGWFAENNLVSRVVDIHTSQLMGRGFDPVSTYTKEDLEAYDQDPNGKLQMQLKNKKLKADADLRHRAAKAIIKDNGGTAVFEKGAQIGSALGTTVYKMYPDAKNKKVVIKLLESPQNYRAGWSDDDFRERDFDGYVMMMSVDKANREYKSKIPEGAEFFQVKGGSPLLDALGSVANPLDVNANGVPSLRSSTDITETARKMVMAIDFTGYLPGWGIVKGAIQEVDEGKETKLSVYDVGGFIVEQITKEKLMPKYYLVNNREIPRQAWGAADVPDSLIDINKEIIRLMADEMAWADKNLWKIMLGHSMTEESLSKLKNKSRKTKLLAVGPEQDLTEVVTTSQPLGEFEKLIAQKLDMFIRISGVGRVMFDDPTVNANSNAALMTTMKGVIDIVESKQKRWEPALVDMFTDALSMAADFIPGLQDALTDDPSWYMTIEWPSILRKEDASYQTMWLNLLNRGAVSVETFMQKVLSVPDTGEEVDRITDEMSDPILSGILANQLGAIAHMTLNKSLGIPPWGYVVPKVSVKGELSPEEMGNIAHNYEWDQGPYGPNIGPQGSAGTKANDAFVNADFLNNATPPASGTPHYESPQQANPQLTPQENSGQAVSQPGSGAPAVSPAGAVAQVNQNNGG